MDSPLWRDTLKAILTYLILMAIVLFFPVIGLVIALFIPMPLVWLSYHHGWKQGTIAALVSSLLLSFLLGPFSIVFTILFAVPGILIGYLFKIDSPAFLVLKGAGLSVTAGVVLLYVATNLFLNIDPVQAFQNAMLESVETSEAILDMVDPADGMVVEDMRASIEFFNVIAPVVMVMISVTYALLIQLVAAHILRKGANEIPYFPPFREWGFPQVFIWYYLAVLMLGFVGFEPGTPVYLAVQNALPALQLIVAIQGMAVVFYYFHHKRKSVIWPFLVLFLVFLLPIFLQLIRILGIIDLGFNLRKRMRGTD